MAAHQREEAALAACSVLQAYKAELSKSPHTTELMAGVANIMISLQVLTTSICSHSQPKLQQAARHHTSMQTKLLSSRSVMAA